MGEQLKQDEAGVHWEEELHLTPALLVGESEGEESITALLDA